MNPASASVAAAASAPIEVDSVDYFMSALLPREAPMSSDYAVNSFLLFTDRADATDPQRHAAALGFLCLFEDVTAADTLGLYSTQLAVIYAPIEVLGNIPRVRNSRDPDALIDSYDYARANVIRNGLSEIAARQIPSVSLVAFNGFDPENFLVVLDLTRRRPDLIEVILKAFRDTTIEHGRLAKGSGHGWEPESTDNLLGKIIDSVGRMISVYESRGRRSGPERSLSENTGCKSG